MTALASAPYGAVFDEVVAQMHIARMQPGATIAVFVDPQNPVDMAIDWIRTGQLGPPPPGSTPGPGEPGARRLATSGLEQDAQQIVRVVPHQVVGAVEFVGHPVRVIANPLV